MIFVIPLILAIFTAVICIAAYILEKVVCFIVSLFALSVLLILLSLSFD